jgi:hypothetical protein
VDVCGITRHEYPSVPVVSDNAAEVAESTCVLQILQLDVIAYDPIDRCGELRGRDRLAAVCLWAVEFERDDSTGSKSVEIQQSPSLCCPLPTRLQLFRKRQSRHSQHGTQRCRILGRVELSRLANDTARTIAADRELGEKRLFVTRFVP